MQSKVNIFHSLQHDSDAEDEPQSQSQNKARKDAEKREQRANQQAKANTNRQTAPVKEEHQKAKGPVKQKGVTADPHPLDRHSGHTNQAYGAKPKKSGAGKGNWGNFKEDRKGNEEQGEAVEGGQEGEEKPQEEEPQGITLSEYYQQRSQTQNAPQVNEAKAKITSDQLIKELGTATALKTRSQQQVDDKKVGKKKDRLDVDHHAAINSEHADLLGFRTGFVEKEYKQRGERGADDFGGQKRSGPRYGDKKEREDAKEETQAQPQAGEGQTAEGQPTEGQAQETAAPEGTSPTGRGDNQNRRGGRGGQRGGPRGDRPQGDRQQGDRPQGDRPRKQYGGKDQAKVNFEDESAFPKLG